MNLLPTSSPNNVWTEKNYLFTLQSVNYTLPTHHSPCYAHQRSCISAEIDSQ